MLIIAGMGELLNSNPDSALVFFISGLLKFRLENIPAVFPALAVRGKGIRGAVSADCFPGRMQKGL